MKRILIALALVLNAHLAFAQDDIDISDVIGGGKYLGARTADNQTIVPVLGLDSSNNSQVNALSGKSVILSAAKTPVASFSSTGSTIPPLVTTYEVVAGAGTTVADAAALSGTKYVHQVTGANGTVGVKFVTATPVGSVQIILNTTAGVLKVYGESGSTVNGGSADAAFSALTGVKPIICIKTAALTYICS
jgi:hypothetical protein